MKTLKKSQKQYARCPQCRTLYLIFRKLDPLHLTKVNCGTCDSTFIAQDHLTEPKNKIILPDKHNPYPAKLTKVTALPETSDFNVSHELEKEIRKPAFKSSEPLFVKSTRPSKEPTKIVGKSTIKKIVQKPKFIEKSRNWGLWGAVAGIILAVNLGVGSVLWFQGGSLCEYWGCENSLNAQHLLIQQHHLNINPAKPQELQLQASVMNASQASQSLSSLQMQIQDLAGNIVQTLVFKPTEYTTSSGEYMLEAGQTTNITVNLKQSMPDLFSYQLAFI